MDILKNVLLDRVEQISHSFIFQAIGLFWKRLASIIAVRVDMLNISLINDIDIGNVDKSY